MPNFSFRVRFHRCPKHTLNIAVHRLELPTEPGYPPVLLTCHPDGTLIQDSTTWVFKSEGWPSEDAAKNAATKYIHSIIRTLARLRIGADFGGRAPQSGFLPYGLAMLEEQSGSRVLNDVHGLMLYESEPPPHFTTIKAKALRGVPQTHFERVFLRAVENFEELTDREELAIELFNSSFFQHTSDSRFVVLMMAVEALLDPSPRSEAAVAHVASMIKATQDAGSLTGDERNSLLGSLKWLKAESISQAGRRLAGTHLGTRCYMEKEAPAFFTYCYGIRSRLVHGNAPFPTQDEVGFAVGELEQFVSDLLSGRLRDIVLT